MEQSFDPQAVAEAQSAKALDDHTQSARTFRMGLLGNANSSRPVPRNTLLEIVKTWLLPFRDAYAAVENQRVRFWNFTTPT